MKTEERIAACPEDHESPDFPFRYCACGWMPPVEVPTPKVGDIVLVTMPADWQPGLGIRVYPAVVLYPNTSWGPGGIDIQVFCSPYHAYGDNDHFTVTPGDGPGQYRPKATP